MKKIIFVEDDQFIRKMYSAIGLKIQETGDYDVLVIADPGEVLAMMEQCEFDILITDFEMPNMNGFELVAQAKALCPKLKCIVCSGNQLPENPDVSFIFKKPFLPTTLIEAISSLS